MINNSLFKLREVQDYYVYGYFDKNEIPFYIGMGKGRRITAHLKESVRKKYRKKLFFYNKLEKIIKTRENFSYRKIKTNLTINEAKIVERFLIKSIGRRDLKNGPLCNLTDGGEGHSGYKRSEESKKAAGDRLRGKKLSKEHKEKISRAGRGRKVSEETRLKISKSQKGVLKGPVRKECIPNFKRAAQKRLNTPGYNEKHLKALRNLYAYKVIQLDMNNNIIKIWDNQYNACDAIKGGKVRGIKEACEGKRSHHKGYKWKYYDK